jgi:hypothetical protein
MVITDTALDVDKQDLHSDSGKDRKHFQVIEKTYQNNRESDYTEKIEALGKGFDYDSNKDHYWGDQELSTLYGTPLYQEASESQKLALNHLYWVGQYFHTASAEANTMLYNQVTCGVFQKFGGYETLCNELDFETDQERYHINTFHRIGYKTKLALLGKEALGNSLHKKLNQSNQLSERLNPGRLLSQFMPNSVDSSWKSVQESTFRWVTKLMNRENSDYYSQFLEEKGQDQIPTATGGLAGLTASPSAFKFMTLNWGSSPFFAAQYYSARMIANMSLKTYEYRYYKRFRDLDKANEFIPTPTAVSYYHLLDESFHTTMSQVISQDVYRDFPKPTAYEKAVSNIIIYLAQCGILGGLSAGIPATFRDDASFMPSFYRLLKSPLFNSMSDQEALFWIEKCLCQEHDGFHTNLKYHQILLSDMRRFFGRLDYLLPVNREMRLMAAGGSIDRAVKRNIAAFQQFSRSVTA